MTQTRTDHNNLSTFLPAEDIETLTGQTLLQDADHSGDVAEFTVLARTAAGALKTLEASDGSEMPIALLKGTIPEADIQAGNVSNVIMYVGGKNFNEADVVLENSLTLDTVIVMLGTAGNTVRDLLRMVGITTRHANTVFGYENS